MSQFGPREIHPFTYRAGLQQKQCPTAEFARFTKRAPVANTTAAILGLGLLFFVLLPHHGATSAFQGTFLTLPSVVPAVDPDFVSLPNLVQSFLGRSPVFATDVVNARLNFQLDWALFKTQSSAKF
jgi:hypothetical protein